MKRELNCVYRVYRKGIFGKLIEKLVGPKYELGYFHRTGYSGNQKGNEVDMCIVELKDGRCVTPSINDVFRGIVRKDYIS